MAKYFKEGTEEVDNMQHQNRTIFCHDMIGRMTLSYTRRGEGSSLALPYNWANDVNLQEDYAVSNFVSGTHNACNISRPYLLTDQQTIDTFTCTPGVVCVELEN